MLVKLFSATLTATLSIFVVGTAYSWTSPVLYYLRSNSSENPFGKPITSLEESLIISLFRFGALFGPYFSVFVVDRIGRKSTLICFAVPLLVSKLLTTFCTSIPYFYFARLFEGIGAGGVYSTLPLYLGEISNDSNRGFISCFMTIMSTGGILYAYILGSYTTIQSLSLACLLPLIPFFIIFGIFMPETPHYWIISGNQAEAIKSLSSFRKTKDIQQDLNAITKEIKETPKSINNICDIFRVQPILKGIITLLILMIFQQFSGVLFLLSNLQFVFAEFSHTTETNKWTMIVGILPLISSLLSSYCVDKFGRRTLLLISTYGVLFSTSCLTFYFYLQDFIDNTEFLIWLPILNMLLMVFFYFMGLGTVPWILISEYFPIISKTKASTIITSFNFLMGFAVAFIFSNLLHNIGFRNSFPLFVLNDCLALIFIVIKIPETSKLSLAEIQILIYGEKKLVDNIIVLK